MYFPWGFVPCPFGIVILYIITALFSMQNIWQDSPLDEEKSLIKI